MGYCALREKINKLANGNISTSTPLVSVEPKCFEIELAAGEASRNELVIYGSDSGYVKGLVYSSDLRVRILTPAFGGYKSVVSFEILLKPTDDAIEYHADISLITNGGEFIIPITVHRKPVSFDDIFINLKSIEDLADIALDDKKSALKIFEYPGFVKSGCMKDLKLQALYSALIPSTDKSVALEQFLAACGYSNDYKAEATSESFEIEDIDSDAALVKSYEEVYDVALERRHLYKKIYYEYSRLRLAYEMGRGNADELIVLMEEQLDRLMGYSRYYERICLLKAEVLSLSGRNSEAERIINSVSEAVLQNRQDRLTEYFLLEYLNITVLGKTAKVPSFIRLCHKFIEEEKMHHLFYYVIKLDEQYDNDDRALHDFLTDVYNYGSRSPLLYYYYSTLINDHPEYLYTPGGIDNQSINFAKKYSILSENISSAVISASCISYIKSDRRSVAVHNTFSEGIELDLKIIGIYEYYMYTIPKDPNYVISDKVLNYYKNGDSLDLTSKTRLYSNVVRFKNHNSNIYRSYETRILNFALNQLKSGNIDEYLSEIYKGVLKPASLEKEYCDKLLKVCSTYKLTTDNAYIRNVYVVYPYFKDPDVYVCKDGNCIIEIYDKNAFIVFRDAFGNRLVNIDHTLNKYLDSDALNNYAEKMSSENKILAARKCSDLIDRKTLNSEDISFLEASVNTLDLSEGFTTTIIKRLINYYNQHTANGYNPDFLLKINKKNLSRDEREDLCNAYITCGCYDEAYEMAVLFGIDGISDRNLKVLCTKQIENSKSDRDPELLNIAIYSFKNSLYNSSILSFLAKNYNGPTDLMYQLLSKCIDNKTETYDLEERLLAQVIFTNDFVHIDRVFEWYVSRKKVSESLLRAYFTLKSADYFINDVKTDNKVFDYLENVLEGFEASDKIPSIYMLAMTKHYYEKKISDSKKLIRAERYIRQLLENKIAFPYFKYFSAFFRLPDSLMNSAILVHKAKDRTVPELYSRIKPQDARYHQDDFNAKYMNLFIKQKLLFTGEEWNYRVNDIDIDSGDMKNHSEGSAAIESAVSRNDRYSQINDICTSYSSGDDNAAILKINEYIKQSYIANKLFK